MNCRAGDGCLHDHVLPHLRDPRPAGPDGYTARAPCHDDRARSLSVSVGDRRQVVWCCHACKRQLGNDEAQRRTRRALIDAGVPAGCLPAARPEAERVVEMVREILHSDASQVDKVFRLAVLTECGGDMPAGVALDDLAEWAGISRRAAYRARQGATDNL